MPFYYSTSTQQNSNASANTDSYTMDFSGIAGLRAVIQKLIAGSYATPADNAIRLRLTNSTTLLTAGTGITPQPMTPDAPAASAVVTTVPAIGAGVLAAVPKIQLAFNQRGTAMWAAFNADEGVAVKGATAPNAELVLVNQCTGTSIAINANVVHSE